MLAVGGWIDHDAVASQLDDLHDGDRNGSFDVIASQLEGVQSVRLGLIAATTS